MRNLVGHVMLGLGPGQLDFAGTMTEVAIGYPKSPLNGPAPGGVGPKPGERVVPIAGQVPMGSGGTPHFSLFAEETPATADLTRRFEALLDPDIRPPFHECGIWLVRPDGYVASSARDADVVAIYLDGIVRPSMQ